MTVAFKRVSRREKARRLREHRAQRKIEHQRWLRWLVAFAQTPAVDQTAMEANRLRQEVADFQGVRFGRLVTDDNAPGYKGWRRRISMIKIVALQRQLISLFEELWPSDPAVSPSTIRMDPSLAGVFLTRIPITGQVAPTMITKGSHTFWWNVILALEQHGPLVRRCMARRRSTRCGHLFVRKRRQTYCSKACARRELARQWYERHRLDEQRRRRVAYQQR
jgi:hypothetical protein